MKKIIYLLSLVLFALPKISGAQTPDQFVKDWERAKAYTRSYMDAMPEDGYSLKPTPDMKSFADQMLHLTDANYELAALCGGITSPLQAGEASKSSAKSKAVIIQLVMDGYDFVISNIKKMKPANFQQNITVFKKYEMTKAVLLSKIFEHQTHHRGQTTVYFHIKGIVPPDQQLF